MPKFTDEELLLIERKLKLKLEEAHIIVASHTDNLAHIKVNYKNILLDKVFTNNTLNYINEEVADLVEQFSKIEETLENFFKDSYEFEFNTTHLISIKYKNFNVFLHFKDIAENLELMDIEFSKSTNTKLYSKNERYNFILSSIPEHYFNHTYIVDKLIEEITQED